MEETLFSISIDDVQIYAQKFIGRHLTSSELYRVAKGIGYGLGHDLDVVINTSIEEAVRV